MQIFYCDQCGMRVSEEDISAQDTRVDGRVLCPKCAGESALSLPAATPAATPKPSSRRLIRPSGRSTGTVKIPVAAPAAPIPAENSHRFLIVAGFIAASGFIVLALALYLKSSNSTPEKPPTATSSPSAMHPPTITAPAAPAVTPVVKPVQDPVGTATKPDHIAATEPDTPEHQKQAQAEFDSLSKFEGLAADDKNGRITRLNEFIEHYGDTIPGARARSLLHEIKARPGPPVKPSFTEVTNQWQSYQVTPAAGKLQATVDDEMGHMSAQLEFYESKNNNGVEMNAPFPAYTPGEYPDDRVTNPVSSFWAPAINKGQKGFPYAGKSLIERGKGEGETATPNPTGVMDLLVHPPNNDHLVVVSFIAPADGPYAITGLAARRTSSKGNSATLKVFNNMKCLIAQLTAMPNRAWVVDTKIYGLGDLKKGDHLYFGVSRDKDWSFDSVQIGWTIQLGRK